MGTQEPAEITEHEFPLRPPGPLVRAYFADLSSMRALAEDTRRRAAWQEEVRRWCAAHPLGAGRLP